MLHNREESQRVQAELRKQANDRARSESDLRDQLNAAKAAAAIDRTVRNSELDEQLVNLQRERVELEGKLAGEDRAAGESRRQAVLLEGRLAAITVELERAKAGRDEQAAQAARAEAELREQLATIRSAAEETERALKAKMVEVSRLEPQVANLRQERQAVYQQFVLEHQAAAKLRRRVDELEKRTVERFMSAVVAGDSQEAYKIWRPNPSFTYQDFLAFWGPKGYYSPIKSFRIESAEVPPKGGSGVVVVVELSAYSPFPKPEESVKFGQNQEARLWVERSDQSLSFPPP